MRYTTYCELRTAYLLITCNSQLTTHNSQLATAYCLLLIAYCLLRRVGLADCGGAGVGRAVGPVVCGAGAVAGGTVDSPEWGDAWPGAVAACVTPGRVGSAAVSAGAVRAGVAGGERAVRATGVGVGICRAAFIGTGTRRPCRLGPGGVYAAADDPAGSPAVARCFVAIPCSRAVRCPASVSAGGRAACVRDGCSAARAKLWGTARLWAAARHGRARGRTAKRAG